MLGVDPWHSASDVYVEKTSDVVEIEGNEAIEIGNDFEEPLLRWASEQLGLELTLNVSLVRKGTVFAANLDGRVPRKPIGAEGKTSSIGGDYGEEGTDQVPNRVIVQTHHQMFVADLELVWVPVLMAEFDRLKRKMFKVERSEKIIDAIRTTGTAFWQDHVLPRVPPDDFRPSADVLARVKRAPGTIVGVDPGLVADYESAKALLKAAEEEAAAARSVLLAAAGGAEGLDFGDPDEIYTYVEQAREGLDSKRMNLRAPDIYRLYLKDPRPFRVLRRVKR